MFGGVSSNGKVTRNTVQMTGGQAKSVYGGSSDLGAAEENRVELSDTATVEGGDVYGGYSDSRTATKNTVTLSGNATVLRSMVNGGEVYGGYSSTGDVTKNTVEMSGRSGAERVHGGFSDNGAATGNTVTISSNAVPVNEIVYGGYSGTGMATENTVEMTGGMVEESVSGGYSYYNAVGATGAGNTVTLSNTAMVKNEVRGGYTPNSTATGNAVTIKEIVETDI